MTPQPFSRFCSRLFLPDFPFFSSNILSFILGKKWATPFRARYFYRGISFWSVQKMHRMSRPLYLRGPWGPKHLDFEAAKNPDHVGSRLRDVRKVQQTNPSEQFFLLLDVFPVFKELFRHGEKIMKRLFGKKMRPRRCQNSFTAQALKRKGLAEVKLFIQP